jgi:hypothetical protein
MVALRAGRWVYPLGASARDERPIRAHGVHAASVTEERRVEPDRLGPEDECYDGQDDGITWMAIDRRRGFSMIDAVASRCL